MKTKKAIPVLFSVLAVLFLESFGSYQESRRS